MPVAPLETFSDYFSDSEFAVDCSYNGGDFLGIFDNAYLGIDGGTVDINATQPVLVCAESDVSGIAYGESVTVDGTGYVVISTRPDGTGMMELFLE